MENRKINFKSDFKIVEHSANGYTVPFRFSYYTDSPKRTHEATFDGTKYEGCKLNTDGDLVVTFDDHGLGCGTLKVERRYYLSDTDYDTGTCHQVIGIAPVVCRAGIPYSEDFVEYNVVLAPQGDELDSAYSVVKSFFTQGDGGNCDCESPFSIPTAGANKGLLCINYVVNS